MKKERVLFKCKTCNKPFSFTKERVEWFKNHNLEVPTHCTECVIKRKASK